VVLTVAEVGYLLVKFAESLGDLGTALDKLKSEIMVKNYLPLFFFILVLTVNLVHQVRTPLIPHYL